MEGALEEVEKGKVANLLPVLEQAQSIVESGPLYDQLLAFYRERGSEHAIREIVMIQVRTAQPIDSPAYDLGLTEEEVRDRMERYFQSLRTGSTTSDTGE